MALRNLDRWVRSMVDEMASLEVPRDLEERFGPYRDDPVGFVRDVLGAEPQPYQREILNEASASPRIAWRAAHGVGKTALLSWLLLWWLLSRPFSRVLILAPAFERQVGRYLFPEVKKWARQAPEPLPITVRASVVEVDGFGREWFALAIQATDSAKIEGAHAESLLVLADEAKGLPADVVAGLHGTQTDREGDRLFFLASVPGGPSGPFFDVFRKGARLWRTFHTPAEESELVSPTWIREREEEWGEGSPLFQARVLGEFPDEAEGTLLRLSDLERAVALRKEQPPGGKRTLGVDVARFGKDFSAVAVWELAEEGVAVLQDLETRHGMDVMEVASWVASLINQHGATRTRVDEIGIGAGVVDRLKQLGHSVQGVNVGRASSRPDLFLNARAELFWRFRERLERGLIALPDDPVLVSELSSLRFSYTASGQIRLEDKEETRKRIGRSPDRADACVLGLASARRRVRATWGS